MSATVAPLTVKINAEGLKVRKLGRAKPFANVLEYINCSSSQSSGLRVKGPTENVVDG